MRNRKRGFTIVELVIVIAVIAILAAVLIPTFSSLINKANKSADIMTVKNINTQLAASEVEDGKNETMYDALLDAKEAGYLVANINARSKNNQLVWDSTIDRFALIDNEGNVVAGELGKNAKKTDLWKVYNTYSGVEDSEYSVYAGNKFVAPNGTVNVSVGFDAGDVNGIQMVNYANAGTESVIIRTNGGALTVNAPNSTVQHYGEAEKVDIVATAQASYHEKGAVQLIAVKKGHVKLESGADVNGIYVYNNSTENNKDTSFAPIKITVDAGVEVPKLSRSAVDIQSAGTKVCTIVTDQAKDVYLFNEGIYEQIKTVDAGKDVATDASAVWADDNSNSENTQTAAQQLANEWNGEVAPTWAANDTTRELADITNKEEALGVDSNATAEEIAEAIEAKVEDSGKTAEEAAVTSALKGNGTASDPFLVYDYETMQKISNFYDKGYYYFAVDLSKTNNGRIDCTGWTPINLNGSFDGKGVKLINIDSRLFANIGAIGTDGVISSWSTTPVTVENFDCYFKLEGDMDAAGGMAKQILGNNTTTLSYINVYGQIVSGSNSGALFSYTTGNPYDKDQNVNQTILVNDCMIYATLVSTSSSVAVVSGYPNYCNPNLVLIVNNPDEIWQGSASNPNGKIKFVTMSSWTMPEGNTPNRQITCNKLNTATLTKDSNGSYSVTQTTNATTARVYISAQLTETDANGNKTAVAGITMALQYMGDYELNSTTQVLERFNHFNFENKTQESSATISNNTLSVKVSGPNNFTFGNIRLVVVECDSNGNVLSYATKDIVTKTQNASSWTII